MCFFYCFLFCALFLFFFFFNDTATTEIYTLSLHDALPIRHGARDGIVDDFRHTGFAHLAEILAHPVRSEGTRLNSSHLVISYAVFCLKKKTITIFSLVTHVLKQHLQQQPALP